MAISTQANRKKQMTDTSIKPADLLNNPANAEIYGTQPDDDLVESVREYGILEPIVADRESLTIISGHRRRQAAIIVGLESVPVRLKDMPDSAKQGIMLIESNRQRVKTKEQILREYQYLESCLSLVAKQAQSEAGGAQPGGNKKGPRKKPAKDLAAADVGLSRNTAEKGSKVVQAIDEAEASGDEEKAKELREELEKGSVSAAHRKATEPEKPTEGPPDRWMTSLQKDITSVARRVEVAMEKDQAERGDETSSVDRWGQEFLTKLRNARTVLTVNKPAAKCSTCKGQKRANPCSDCSGTGWLTKRQAEILIGGA